MIFLYFLTMRLLMCHSCFLQDLQHEIAFSLMNNLNEKASLLKCFDWGITQLQAVVVLKCMQVLIGMCSQKKKGHNEIRALTWAAMPAYQLRQPGLIYLLPAVPTCHMAKV